MTNSPLISRKEIAELAGVSVDTVKRKEQRWGLDACRSKANERQAVYHRARAVSSLLKLGVIDQPAVNCPAVH